MRRLRGRVQPPRLTGTFLHTAAHRRLTLFDLIIRNGTIIDGTRADRYPADIGLRADRIAAIGDLGNTQSQHSIDAQGKIVAPGFVDVHNHSDGWLLQQPNFLPKTLQGFTTEVLMADGISYAPVDAATRAHWLYYMRALNGLMQSHYSGWESLADYMQLLDGRTAQNTITHLPYAHLRAMACGWDRRVPDDVQMEEILAGVARGMAEGAVGVSTGLDYIAECFATTDELVEACTAMAAQQGLYVTHVRYKKGHPCRGARSRRNRSARRRPGPHLPFQGHLAPADRRTAVVRGSSRGQRGGLQLRCVPVSARLDHAQLHVAL